MTLDGVNTPHSDTETEIIYKGIPVSDGIVIGKAYKYDSGTESIPRYSIEFDKTEHEINRLNQSLAETKKELVTIQAKVSQSLGNEFGNIFSAHLLLIEDTTVLEEVSRRIRTERKNAEYIFSDVMNRFKVMFNEMEDSYIRERVYDIDDVSKRVLKNLQGKRHESIKEFRHEGVLVAYDLSPSDTAQIHHEKILGFATDIGGKTSHTAIMARSMGIPAVVGLHNVSQKIRPGVSVILDGTKGLLIINPSEETCLTYEKRKHAILDYNLKINESKELDAVSLDGIKIDIMGNIEIPEDVEGVIANGAEGIGLYRTEFCYMNRDVLPTEDELTQNYQRVAESMNGKPVVIRTIDMGGDKFLGALKLPLEMNPFLGWRAIRFCLERVDIFKVQLRAILRASKFKNVKVMYPMISNLEELRDANEILRSCMRELTQEGVEYNPDIEIGAMIEIPSAALISEHLAQEIQFFSIGTNDLIQYSLAVDRINEKIAYLYQPLHPAIIRLIQLVQKNGLEKQKTVSVCGEMASDPNSIIYLLGIGIRSLSLSPGAVPRIKHFIRSLTISDCEKIVSESKNCQTEKELLSIVATMVKNIIPEI